MITGYENKFIVKEDYSIELELVYRYATQMPLLIWLTQNYALWVCKK